MLLDLVASLRDGRVWLERDLKPSEAVALVITSTEDVASVHGSFPSAPCNEDRPIREVGADVARLCAVSQLTTGYRGNRNWRDMSEYAVHFTKPAATSSPYDVMIKILWEGRINAVTPRRSAQAGEPR